MGMPTGDAFHRCGECYHCASYFCFEHLMESKNNMMVMACIFEYYDNRLCVTCQMMKSGMVVLCRLVLLRM
jgi:hypothetical protein